LRIERAYECVFLVPPKSEHYNKFILS
jgi:hypothetical protein